MRTNTPPVAGCTRVTAITARPWRRASSHRMPKRMAQDLVCPHPLSPSPRRTPRDKKAHSGEGGKHSGGGGSIAPPPPRKNPPLPPGRGLGRETNTAAGGGG